MMLSRTIALATATVVAAFACPVGADDEGISSAFTYQAQLTRNGVPANDAFDMQFRMWDAPTGGNQVGFDVFMPGVPVLNGRLTESLDFGPNLFNGAARYLEVMVYGDSGPITLSPRQMITPAPESRYAATASEAIGRFRVVPSFEEQVPRLYFGQGVDMYIGGGVPDQAFVFSNPGGARMFNPQPEPPRGHTLYFGLGNDTYMESRGEGELTGLILSDPLGARIIDPGNDGRLYFGMTNDRSIGLDSDIANALIFVDPNGFVFDGGFVGLGLTGADYRLTLPNDAGPSGQGVANAWMTFSSVRWKENVRSIEDPLSLIGRLRGVRYDWKAEQGGAADIGFIAEEVGAVLPELVAFEEDGTWARSLDTDGIVAVAVEGIRAQQSQIDDLRDANTTLAERLASLSAENESLRERLSRLETTVGGGVALAEVDR